MIGSFMYGLPFVPYVTYLQCILMYSCLATPCCFLFKIVLRCFVNCNIHVTHDVQLWSPFCCLHN